VSVSSAFTCDVTTENPGPVSVLVLTGSLDPAAVPVLEAVIERELQAGRRRFVLDLGRLTYVGSLGLRALVRLHNQVKADGAVTAFDPTPNVQSVLDVTKVGQVLRVYPTRQDALDAARTR
jgi:anti-sigma B factor antagonist